MSGYAWYATISKRFLAELAVIEDKLKAYIPGVGLMSLQDYISANAMARSGLRPESKTRHMTLGVGFQNRDDDLADPLIAKTQKLFGKNSPFDKPIFLLPSDILITESGYLCIVYESVPLEENNTDIKALHKKIMDIVEDDDIKLTPDVYSRDNFKPHITLSRIRIDNVTAQQHIAKNKAAILQILSKMSLLEISDITLSYRGSLPGKQFGDHVLFSHQLTRRDYGARGFPMLLFSRMKTLDPPSAPKEAILSRRNPCYGFAILADIRDKVELNSLLMNVRDSILLIVDPTRSIAQRPIRSPFYIKQKHFHAAVFGMRPLLDQQDYFALSNEKDGLLTSARLNQMRDTLKIHLIESKPYLEPIGFELMPNDGTILARFAYKTENADPTPLLTLTSQLDSDKVFAKWDASNPNRFMTVTIALVVVDINAMDIQKVESIKAVLEDMTTELKKLGNIDIGQFRLIAGYDKRTLSEKHITAECKPVTTGQDNTLLSKSPRY